MARRTLALCGLLGCTGGPAQMGQFGEEEDLLCVEVSREPAAAEVPVELGSPDDLHSEVPEELLADLAGTHSETLEWSSGEQTEVSAVLGAPIGFEVVTTEPVDSEIDPKHCSTFLAFEVDGVLTTDDGRLDESFVATGRGAVEGVYLEHRVVGPVGTIDVEGLAQEGVDVEPDVVRVEMMLDATEPFRGTLLPQPIGGIDDDAQFLGRWPVWEDEQ